MKLINKARYTDKINFADLVDCHPFKEWMPLHEDLILTSSEFKHKLKKVEKN